MPEKTDITLHTGDGYLAQPGDKESANAVLNMMSVGKLYIALGIAWFCDSEAKFRMIGCQTEKEFIETHTGMSARQGKKYKVIGNQFFEMFPGMRAGFGGTKLLTGGETSTALVMLDQDEGVKKMADFFRKVGLNKFMELTRYDVDLGSIVDSNTVTLPNGDVVDVDELVATKSRDLVDRLAQAETASLDLKRQLSAVKSRADEEKKMHAAELKVQQEKIANAEALEMRFGGVAATLEFKNTRLREARQFFDKMRSSCVEMDLQESDPEQLQTDVLEFIKRVANFHEWLNVTYGFTKETLL